MSSRRSRRFTPRLEASSAASVVNGKASGDFEIFAQVFAGREPLMNPGEAAARADGVAQAPDGSRYIAESQKGKFWRVRFKGA
jgi:glucose/arabinose dehydrogenase